MRITFSITLIFSLILGLLPLSSVADLVEAESNSLTERYIVFFDKNVDAKEIETVGGKVIKDFPMINAASVEMSPNRIPALERLPSFQKITKEQTVEKQAQTVPWAHGERYLNIKAKQPSTLTGKGVKVAVIDSGVDKDHPDLRVKGGKCVLDLSKDPKACANSYDDQDGHGTHVAGIIGALNNGIGMVGVAPGAEIYALKALDADGYGSSTTIMAGIQWAIQNKMDIINLSLSSSEIDYGIKAMVDKAYQRGIIVVSAAGNRGDVNGKLNTVEYPGAFANVISVAATNASNQRIPYSATGPELDFSAPGEQILSTLPGGKYGLASGTSMAAPHVTGMIALYMEKYPSASNRLIRDLLEWNSRDLGVAGKDRLYGAGLVQVDPSVILNDEIPLEFNASENGTVTIDMKPVLEKFTEGYNIYRFNQPLKLNATDETIVDYGSKGSIEYRIHPIEKGVENRRKMILLYVIVETPYFSDLSNDAWFSPYLVLLHQKNILYGYSENRLMPNKLVTRAEAVTMLGRALGLNGEQRATRFTDVPAASFASGYAEAAAELGIIRGRVDGSFKPDQPVTRAEMAMLLARAYNLPEVEGISFTDVNSSLAGYKEISNLAGAKITEGYADGSFKPGASMERATYAVFLAKAEELKQNR
jgi:subtilisin